MRIVAVEERLTFPDLLAGIGSETLDEKWMNGSG